MWKQRIDKEAEVRFMRLMTYILFVLGCIVLLVCCGVDPYKKNGWHTEFTDDFEGMETDWGIFEEICVIDIYQAGIGLVATTTQAAYEGERSLCVWANEQKSEYSNHLSANYRFSEQGNSGRWRYEVNVYIPSATSTQGQVGPEFSMQNTRQTEPGVFRTSTAGIQYLANTTMAECGTWYVWHEAHWTDFLTFKLETDTWYTLAVEADFSTNEYVFFDITRGDVTDRYDFETYRMAREIKPDFDSEGFSLTCESENIWGVQHVDYMVYYDSVVLSQWY
jgi:hypothetical protein